MLLKMTCTLMIAVLMFSFEFEYRKNQTQNVFKEKLNVKGWRALEYQKGNVDRRLSVCWILKEIQYF